MATTVPVRLFAAAAKAADDCPSGAGASGVVSSMATRGGGGDGTTNRRRLVDVARRAVAADPDQRKTAGAAEGTTETFVADDGEDEEEGIRRSVAVARRFLVEVCPEFLQSDLCSSDSDRLVKIGRSVADLVSLATDDAGGEERDLAEASLRLLVETCAVLATQDVQVPTVRFGRTELDMPIVSLGCMRFQQAWGPKITSMDDVTPECQANVVAILRRAAKLGVTHLETARGYGCSELQMGVALRQLFDEGEIQREDFIIQTKVAAKPSVAEFRETLEESFRNLQLDYVDLFSFHGVNLEGQFELIFNNGDDSLINVVKEYVADGRIRHVGFSTHARPTLIRKLIDTDEFDYVNLHYHYFGSYTASGDGLDGEGGGNRDIIRLLKEKDMGAFIISVNDKGGRLYAPSRKLRALTLPEMEPMAFGSAWLWNHAALDDDAAGKGGGGAPVHTVSVGAARPSDLDEIAAAAHLHGTRPLEMLERVRKVVSRLRRAEEDALGSEWVNSWHEGLPNWDESSRAVPHTFVVWLHNVVKAYGMLEFARDRYGPLANNLKKWDATNLDMEENIDTVGRIGWGWTPGCGVSPGENYESDLADLSEKQRERVREAEEFVRVWCDRENQDEREVPREWKTAYDMRPWIAYPERKN